MTLSEVSLDSKELVIEKICRVHPCLQKETLTQQLIVAAAFDEMRRHDGWSGLQGLQFLLGRTEIHRQMTDEWPEDQKRYIMSSPEFFRSGEYRTDPKHWERIHETGISKADQQQQRNRAAIVRGLEIGSSSGARSGLDGAKAGRATINGGTKTIGR